MIIMTFRFQKVPGVFKMLSVHPKTQRWTVFKFLQFEECFRKALFSCRISVDGRPNRRNKAEFSTFYRVLRADPKKRLSYLNI